AAAARAVASPHLDLLGLHAFGASNVLDATALAGHVAATVRTARRLGLQVGIRLRLIDAGGGLGIPYEPHEESLDLAGLGSGLAAIVDGWTDDPLLAGARPPRTPGGARGGASWSRPGRSWSGRRAPTWPGSWTRRRSMGRRSRSSMAGST